MVPNQPTASSGDMRMQDSEARRDERRNQMANRKQRRRLAKDNKLFKYGLWPKLTVPDEQNVQTITKEATNGKEKQE